jgi:hypothetical protein
VAVLEPPKLDENQNNPAVAVEKWREELLITVIIYVLNRCGFPFPVLVLSPQPAALQSPLRT